MVSPDMRARVSEGGTLLPYRKGYRFRTARV